MAKKLSEYYDIAYAQYLADKLTSHSASFRPKTFLAYIRKHLADQPFLEIQDIFAQALERSLPVAYASTLRLFTAVLGPELASPSGMFSQGWWLWPIGRYVERNGAKDFQASMDFIYELTKRHTGEYAVRPLLEQYGRQTMLQLNRWSMDANVHIRRLSSEGMRIRLPWAKKSTAALEHYDLFCATLTNLKNSTENFVQKSVANNLNDLYRTDRAKADCLVSSWEKEGVSSAAQWIIRHGQRNISKP